VSTGVGAGRALEDLKAERDFLLRSIADLEREHDAGDVDDADFAALRESYVTRAAEVLRALEAATVAAPGEAGGAEAGAPGGTGRMPAPRWRRFRRFLGRRRTRRVLAVVGTCCVLAVAALAAADLAGVRLPGETATGTITLPSAAEVRQELAQASVLGTAGDLQEAVALYDAVLNQVPNQPEALAYRGWLVRLIGQRAPSATAIREGDASIARAVRADPSYPDARALDGIALLQDSHDRAAALVEFRGFLADHPPAALLAYLGAQMAAAFQAGHQAVPAALRRYEHPASASGSTLPAAEPAAPPAS
jgi:tetratricopeptide (TPR) repeat protein